MSENPPKQRNEDLSFDLTPVAVASACLTSLSRRLVRQPRHHGGSSLELLATSPRFAIMWAQHRVEVPRTTAKRLRHRHLPQPIARRSTCHAQLHKE
jgi:hypothetical protein